LSKTGIQGCPTEVTLSNKLGSFQGNAGNSALGSARRITDKIAAGERKVYEFDVPPGAENVSAAINQLSDPAARLDLYLYQVIKGVAVPRDSSTGDVADKTVRASQPGAGRWKVVVDAFNVPSGSTSYAYMDLFTHAAFGSIAVEDQPAMRMSGTQWTIRPQVSLGAVPAGDRTLEGVLPVVSNDVGKDWKDLTTQPGQKNPKPPTTVGSASFVFK